MSALEYLRTLKGTYKFVACRAIPDLSAEKKDRLWIDTKGGIVVITLDRDYKGVCRYVNPIIDYVPETYRSEYNIESIVHIYEKKFNGVKCVMYWMDFFMSELNIDAKGEKSYWSI